MKYITLTEAEFLAPKMIEAPNPEEAAERRAALDYSNDLPNARRWLTNRLGYDILVVAPKKAGNYEWQRLSAEVFSFRVKAQTAETVFIAGPRR